jgi:hypothetical protein
MHFVENLKRSGEDRVHSRLCEAFGLKPCTLDTHKRFKCRFAIAKRLNLFNKIDIHRMPVTHFSSGKQVRLYQVKPL